MINEAISKLVTYALRCGLVEECKMRKSTRLRWQTGAFSGGHEGDRFCCGKSQVGCNSPPDCC